MALITFFEKPGCINNTRQKKILRNAGHQLIERDLLAEPWTAGRLRRFFGSLPVAEWFNPAAPAIKSGDVKPASLDADTALKMMIEDPLLIRRPLMISGSLYLSGFDADQVNAMLGLAVLEAEAKSLQQCARDEEEVCRSAVSG